jgi:GAF domain-containing protein
MDENLSLIEAQFAASGTIYGSDDPAEILAAITAFADIPYRRADLGLLADAPELGDASPRTPIALIAEIDSSGAHGIEKQRKLGEYPAFDAIAAIEVLHIEDVSSDTFLEAEEREHLLARGVRSMVVLPLVVSQRLIGMIAIEADVPTQIPAQRLRALRQLGDQAAVVFQNRALLKIAETRTAELGRQVTALQAINRIATGVNSMDEEREMLDYTTRLIVEVFGADRCGIALIEPDREYSVVVSEVPGTTLGLRIPLKGNPLLDLVMEDLTRPLVIHNTQTDPRLRQDMKDLFRSINTRAILIAPLVVQNELIGTLGIDIIESPLEFNDDIANTAQTLAAQLAIGLQNHRLILEAQRRADQLAHIARFAQKVQTTFELPTILEIMMTESAEMLPLDRLIIGLHDPRTGGVRIAARYDREGHKVNVNPDPHAAGTFAQQIWNSGEPLLHADTLELPGTRAAIDIGLRSIIGAPIRESSRTLGVVVAGGFRPRMYGNADMALFLQLLNQFAVTLENSEAYAQTQRAARNEALVNQIAAEFQRTTDISAMARTALRQLATHLNARTARIRLSPDALLIGETAEVRAARNAAANIPDSSASPADQW